MQASLLAVPFLISSCAAGKVKMTAFESVDSLVTHGKFAEAVEEAARFREEDPVNEDYERLHRDASVAYLLEQARRASFADDDRLAIARLDDVLELDPNSELGKLWINKTRNKLAARLTDEGIEMASNNQYQQAWNRYQEAVQVSPDFTLAIDAMAALDRQVAHREAMSSEYYDQGVAALVASEYSIASNRFGYVRKYRDEDERLIRRIAQVDNARSKESLDLATLLEAERLFHAARAEFQDALRFNPDNGLARQGINRCDIEAEVASLMARGISALTRKEFIRANVLLGEAERLSVVQKEDVIALLADVDEAQWKAKYESGVRFENDLRFEEAVIVYADLLVTRPEFLDTAKRMANLENRINKSSELYASVLAEKNSGQQLIYLMQIEELFPDYRDVPERIAALERIGIKANTRLPEGTKNKVE